MNLLHPSNLRLHRSALHRLGAAATDAILALLVAFVVAMPGSGPFKAHLFGGGLLLASAFVLLRDSLPSVIPHMGSELLNRSPGKVAMGLLVWSGSDKTLEPLDALKRNATLAAPLLVWGITRTLTGYAGFPYWRLLLNLSLLLLFVEIAFVCFAPDGRRLGDRWAGTKVYEG